MSARERFARIWATVRRRPVDRRLAVIWGIAILIRLALLPIAAHLDLYAIYSRSAQAVYDGEWLAWGTQLAIQMLHNVWFLLVSPLLPDSRDIWSGTAAVFGVGVQQHEFQAFLDYEYLPRALFLLKLPYFIADLAVAYLLMQLVRPDRRALVAGLWLLNPLVVYTSILFGRHDSLAILIVIASTLMAVRGWRYSGLSLLVLGAAIRFFPVLLAPFFVIAFRRSRRELAILTTSGLLAWIVLDGTIWAVSGSSPTLTLLNRYPHVEYLFQLSLPLYELTAFGQALEFYLFPLAYALLVLWFYQGERYGLNDYVIGAAAAFLLVFTLTFYHPQYSIWLVPFIALAAARYRFLVPLHIVQVVLLLVHTLQWGSATTWELFLPLSQGAVAALPDPRNVISAQMPLNLFFSSARTILAAVSIWMGWRVLSSSSRLDDLEYDASPAAPGEPAVVARREG
jgi:hypothetical protein